MGQSNHHERPEDIGRPHEPSAEQDEHDPFSFESMCAVADQSNRLQALLEKNKLLRHSVALAEDADADGLTFRDRVADGHMTPADAERLQGEAEEQGEER